MLNMNNLAEYIIEYIVMNISKSRISIIACVPFAKLEEIIVCNDHITVVTFQSVRIPVVVVSLKILSFFLSFF